MARLPVESTAVQSSAEANFIDSVCLPLLLAAQNDDGGWGFRRGSESRVEPSAWALLALQERESSGEAQQAGFKFLHAVQLPDGSWPSSPGQRTGCWVTSLAVWALTADLESRPAVSAGIRWLCDDWPRRDNLVLRMIRKARSRERAKQNDSLPAWGWTPRTASWVEPTAFALLALDRAPKELLPGGARERIELGKLLIYDRMCPGGGWNCGNPMVYGVPGDPLIEPTVWALLALRNEADTENKALSLRWLEKNLKQTSGPGSAALAKACLGLYGRAWPADAPSLAQIYLTNEFLGSVPVAAWACLAHSPGGWLREGVERPNANG
jgi:hypothetical protein